MKFLRALWIILAGIIFLPIIVIIEICFLAFTLYACIAVGESKRTFEVWLRYIKAGIEMNLNFIENGLD